MTSGEPPLSVSKRPLDITSDFNDDIDQCWKNYRDLFLAAADTFVPKLKITNSNSLRWTNGQLIIKISKRS